MISIKKIPIVEVGQMVYHKEDPDKAPMKWRIWSDAEWRKDCIEFCNPKEARYRYLVEFKWSFSFKINPK